MHNKPHSKGIRRGRKSSFKSPISARRRQASILGRYSQRRDQMLRNLYK